MYLDSLNTSQTYFRLECGFGLKGGVDEDAIVRSDVVGF